MPYNKWIVINSNVHDHLKHESVIIENNNNNINNNNNKSIVIGMKGFTFTLNSKSSKKGR